MNIGRFVTRTVGIFAVGGIFGFGLIGMFVAMAACMILLVACFGLEMTDPKAPEEEDWIDGSHGHGR